MNSQIESNPLNSVQENNKDNQTSIVNNSIQTKSVINTTTQNDSSYISSASNNVNLDPGSGNNFVNYNPNNLQNYEHLRSTYSSNVLDKPENSVEDASNIHIHESNNIKIRHATSHGSSNINQVYPFLSMGSSQPYIPIIQTEHNGVRLIKSHTTSIVQPSNTNNFSHQLSNSTKVNSTSSCSIKNSHSSTNGFFTKTVNYSNSGDKKDMSNATTFTDNNTTKQIQQSTNPEIVCPDKYMLQPFIINNQPVRFIPIQTPILIDSNINSGIPKIPTYSPFCLRGIPPNYVNYPSDRLRQQQLLNLPTINHHKSKSVPQFPTTDTYANQPTEIYHKNVNYDNSIPNFEISESKLLDPSTVIPDIINSQENSDMMFQKIINSPKSVDLINQDNVTNDEGGLNNRFTVETVLEVNNNKNLMTEFMIEENGNKEYQDNYHMTAANMNDENEPIMKPRSRFKKTRVQEKIERWNFDEFSGFDCRVTIIPDEILQLSKSQESDLCLKEININEDSEEHQYYQQPTNYHMKEFHFWSNGFRKCLASYQNPNNTPATADQENLCLFHAKYQNLVNDSETLYSDTDPPLSLRNSPSPNFNGLYDINSYNDVESELLSYQSHYDYSDDDDYEESEEEEPEDNEVDGLEKQDPIVVTTPRNSPRMEPPPNLVIGQQQNFIPLQFPIYNTYQDNSVVVDNAIPFSSLPRPNSSTPLNIPHTASMFMMQQSCSLTTSNIATSHVSNHSSQHHHPSYQLLDTTNPQQYAQLIHCTSPIDEPMNLRPLETIQDPSDEVISHNNNARLMFVGSPSNPITVTGSLLSTSPNKAPSLLLANPTTLSHMSQVSPLALSHNPPSDSSGPATGTKTQRSRKPRFRQYSQGGCSTLYYPQAPACCTLPFSNPTRIPFPHSFMPHRDSTSSFRLSQSSTNSQDIWPSSFSDNGPPPTSNAVKQLFDSIDIAFNNFKSSIREDIHRKFFEMEHDLTNLRNKNRELTQNYECVTSKCEFLEQVLKNKSTVMSDKNSKTIQDDKNSKRTKTPDPPISFTNENTEENIEKDKAAVQKKDDETIAKDDSN